MASPSASDYKQYTSHEHVLNRPSSYIGSFETNPREVYSYDYKKAELKKTKVTSPASLEHLYKEIVSNAGDNVQTSLREGFSVSSIKIEVDQTTVTVTNDGRWIPIEKKGDIYVPELIFGSVYTSSNYGKEQRQLIGQNGIGAKAANIFSKVFLVDCYDPQRKLRYQQMWKDNMFTKGQPKITENYTEKSGPKSGRTTIKYMPDFSRFGVDKFTEDDINLYANHAATLSFTNDIPVYFNGTKIHLKNSKDYAKLLFPKGTKTITYSDERCDIVIADTPDNSTHMSFVNGQFTEMGGVHLDEAIKNVTDTMQEIFSDSGISLRKPDIERHISVVISCRVDNPRFKSQTKEYYTGPSIRIRIPKETMTKIRRWKMVDSIRRVVESKQIKKLKKTDGRNTKKRIDDPDCVDANLAGKKSNQCVLILNEGKSAMGYAKKFVKHYPGRSGHDYYGMIPLKGVPLNAYNAKFERILENKEFQQIKRFMGLREETDYTKDSNYRKLRYGTIWIMVDADNDGKHIAGLLLLFFMQRFPSVVERGMIRLFRTPIIRARKAKSVVKFYTQQAFDEWQKSNSLKGWNFKYYKGLASSTDKDIAEDHRNPNIVTFVRDPMTMDAMIKAFDKTKSDERKRWLSDFVYRSCSKLENIQYLNISMFIDQEMIHHSFASLVRSIPEIDGFKEAARKVFYSSETVLKPGNELKVTLLASATSERCNYKYGEKSLQDAIATSAMEVIGTNNLPIFKPEGIIGSRDSGKNESAPRYIFVGHNWWTPYIFRKEDRIILEQDLDEGMKIEWKTYYPVLPTILFNMQTGISTAYRCEIPPFHPLQIASWLIQRLDGSSQLPELVPWFKGHTGVVRRRPKNNGFSSEGRYYIQSHESDNTCTIIVEELPVRLWTNRYKKFLISLKEAGTITEYYPIGEGDNISFRLEGWKGDVSLAKLGLIKRFSFKNMTIMQRVGDLFEPIIFTDVNDLMEHFYSFRYNAYMNRKNKILERINLEREYTDERCRFVRSVIDGSLRLNGIPISEVLDRMKEMKFKYSDHLDKVTSRHYTKEEVNRLEDKVRSLELQLEITQETSVEDMWKKEIQEFVDQFTKRCPDDLNYPVYQEVDDNEDSPVPITETSDDEED